MLTRISSVLPGFAITYSQEAEEKLVSNLIESVYFDRPKIQRLLAEYPGSSEYDKGDLICAMMQELWPAGYSDSFFKTFRSFDHFFREIGKRDHFLHQFEVFLFGLNVLHQIKERLLSSAETPNDDFNFYMITWLVAATAHDFGYPLEVAPKLFKSLGLYYKTIRLSTIEESLLSIDSETLRGALAPLITPSVLEVIINSLENTFFIDQNKAGELKNELQKCSLHAFASAAIVASIILDDINNAGNDPKLEIQHKLMRRVLERAIGAIIAHDIPKQLRGEDLKIHFDKNPFAYVLFLSDQIQDWFRYVKTEPRWPVFHLEDVSFSTKEITLKFVLTDSNWDATMESRVRGALSDKESNLKLLQGPVEPFGLKVSFEYKSNHAAIHKIISIEI